MQLEITGRHIQIDKGIREFTEEKLRRLTRLLEESLDVHLVLGAEKHRHTAEIHVRSGHAFLAGSAETDDPHAAIADVVEKLERQARKYKEKLTDHKHRRGHRDPDIAATIEANAGAEASAEPEPAARLSRIVPGAPYRTRPMSAEDAAVLLESGEEEIVVFRDLDSDRISVLHRRDDGNFGLIETER
ncbi:MAG: ribosome-associated translation inhibitor RaiA [Acidobacteriota bacterium]|nr:ribosome-associated translation inhibitor RaiA [Acidobacteriota bacterium]